MPVVAMTTELSCLQMKTGVCCCCYDNRVALFWDYVDNDHGDSLRRGRGFLVIGARVRDV